MVMILLEFIHPKVKERLAAKQTAPTATRPAAHFTCAQFSWKYGSIMATRRLTTGRDNCVRWEVVIDLSFKSTGILDMHR